MELPEPVLIELDADLAGALDIEAAELGISRSELIRRVMAQHVADAPKTEPGRWVDRYKQSPMGTISEWGDLDAQLAGAASEALRRHDENGDEPA
ncbi:MAG: ribbon-helix-helix domain-containing protein [Acidimicrobiia bacterium]|nr:ribbon-helix-helix domain-containing protein [Acidimicrobiia bacterium]